VLPVAEDGYLTVEPSNDKVLLRELEQLAELREALVENEQKLFDGDYAG